MVPCCLNVITCEEHDRLVQGPPMVGGAIGKHHYCPANAGEAHRIVSGCKSLKFMIKGRRSFLIIDK